LTLIAKPQLRLNGADLLAYTDNSPHWLHGEPVNSAGRQCRDSRASYRDRVDTSQKPDAPVSAPLTDRALDVFAALAGITTAFVTLAVAAVLALFFGLSNPLIAVGSLVIDLAPPGAKTFIISLFGTGDKAFIIGALVALVLVLAVVVGILQRRRPPLGYSLYLVAVLVALVATLTRANTSIADALPTVGGAILGILLFRVLLRRLELWRGAATRKPARSAYGVPLFERRSFLQLALGFGVVSLVVGAGAQILSTTSDAVAAVRRKIVLPRPVIAAPPIPTSAELRVPGISPYIVSANEFYRIDTALQVPSVDPTTWRLTIGGMVENEIEFTFEELLKLPLEEHIITLACVSQEVGGNLIGNARWLGYPVRKLLSRARPTAGADMVLSTSVDGFTAGTPLGVLQDASVAGILAVGMNGEPLTPEHGFPVRMVVPGLYGYVSATKWLANLKLTTFAKDQGYWVPRGWSAKGPIKISSRIDTPQDGRSLPAGTLAIAGVAWHQHVGIKGVQVQIDGGAWRDADLATVVTVDSWLQWSYAWQAIPGNHTIAVRAIDDSGQVQTAALADPAPNGSTGHHTIRVSVS
jgi:DMSO/TMAO reductase YedYZ molybdopterin-dependent catalytic subunit